MNTQRLCNADTAPGIVCFIDKGNKKENMRTLTIFLAAVLFSTTVMHGQTIYYYDGSGPLSTAGNWFTARNGTGSSPANFTTASQHFYIQAGQTVTNSAAWSISGSNTRLVVEGTATLTTNTAITLAAATTFELRAGATYVHNNTNTTSILAGTESFAATSTFRISNWSTGSSVTANITASAPGFDGNNYFFGNLEVAWAAGAVWSQNFGTGLFYLCAGNLTFTSTFTGTFRFTANSGTPTPDVYVAGNFTWQSAGTLDMNSRNAAGYLNVNGNITQSAGTITVSGNGSLGAVAYLFTYGSGSCNWSFTGGTRDLLGYRVVLQGTATSKLVNLQSNLNMSNGGSGLILSVILNVGTGCTLDAGPHIMSISAGSTQAAVSGTIRTSNVNGLTGSTSTTFSNSPLVQWGVGTDCTVEYYATGAQTVSAVPIYENVRIMNGGTKTLAGNANVFKTFSFNGAGNYLDAGNNTLTIESTGSISGAGSTAYFITGAGTTAGGGGRLRQNSFSTARTFPVGTGSRYFPLTITPSAAGSFAANAFSTTGMDGIVQSSAIKQWPEKTYIADVMWNIDNISGGASATVQFNWDADALEGSWFTTRPDNELAVWHRVTDTIWTPAATGFSPASNTTNFVTAVNIAAGNFNTQFVPAWQTQILPVAFVYFTGTAVNNGARLYWQLENQQEVRYMEVEAGENNRSFSRLGVLAPGPSTQYMFLHTHMPVTYYYRIKLFLKNGGVQYSPVIKVQHNSPPVSLLTPLVHTELILQYQGAAAAMCRVYDGTGRLVAVKQAAGSGPVIRLPVQEMAAGHGVVTLTAGSRQYTFQFIKH